MIHNVRLYARYVKSEDNFLADALSRGELAKFRSKAKQIGLKMNEESTEIPEPLWPMNKLWLN